MPALFAYALALMRLGGRRILDADARNDGYTFFMTGLILFWLLAGAVPRIKSPT